MSDKKDAQYNETAQKKDEQDVKNALKSKSTICGIVAIPGEYFQSGVITAKCTSCSQVGPTTVESAWNMKAYLCCYWYGAYFWCHQQVKGKDYTLKDGTHKCSKCSTELGKYVAC
jgi:hypothetical protein